MDGQMTIFDFLPPPEDDLETLDEVKRCCTNCDRYRMTVDATTCEPRYMICHRPGTVYGDQITNPEIHVCECWEERGENDDN